MEKTFTIIAENNSAENVNVSEVFLNGQKLDRNYITYSEIMEWRGTQVHHEMNIPCRVLLIIILGLSVQLLLHLFHSGAAGI